MVALSFFGLARLRLVKLAADAQDAGSSDAHDAKKGRGERAVNIYNDKTMVENGYGMKKRF